MALTRPTLSVPSASQLTLRVVCAPENYDMDGPQFTFTVADPMLDVLEDQDVDDIAAIFSGRLASVYPGYYVAVEKTWTAGAGTTSRTFTHSPTP
ncbi:hypothetical protein AB0M86_45415 [Streptomyces sp. NPDC051639]|uniref:hypothetical protein n=1 Tax=Streptomyces sp. NPDC051639 TaxID=3155671 RepID=UPI00341316AA